MQSIRSMIKSALSLLALFCAFGVVGSMDYHDAVMMEETQQRLDLQECPKSDSLSPKQTDRHTLSEAQETTSASACQVLMH